MYTHVYCSTMHIAKIWNQSSCLSINNWKKKMWHIYTVTHYLAIKKEWNPVSCNKMDAMESLMLSKIWQFQKTNVFSLICGSQYRTHTQKKCRNEMVTMGYNCHFLAYIYALVKLWSCGLFTLYLLNTMISGKLSLQMWSGLKLWLCK